MEYDKPGHICVEVDPDSSKQSIAVDCAECGVIGPDNAECHRCGDVYCPVHHFAIFTSDHISHQPCPRCGGSPGTGPCAHCGYPCPRWHDWFTLCQLCQPDEPPPADEDGPSCSSCGYRTRNLARGLCEECAEAQVEMYAEAQADIPDAIGAAPDHPAGILALLVDVTAPLRCQQYGRLIGSKGFFARERCPEAATCVQLNVGRYAPGPYSPQTAAYCEAHAPAQNGGPDGNRWVMQIDMAARLMRAAVAMETLMRYAEDMPYLMDADVFRHARNFLSERSGLDRYRERAWEAYHAAQDEAALSRSA